MQCKYIRNNMESSTLIKENLFDTMKESLELDYIPLTNFTESGVESLDSKFLQGDAESKKKKKRNKRKKRINASEEGCENTEVPKLENERAAKIVNLARNSLRVQKISENAFIPTRGTLKSAGWDLYSAYDYTVPSRGKELIKTDLSIGIPNGTYARIAARSGLAFNHHIDVGAGVIDYDYRGNVCVLLFNHSEQDFQVRRGDRVAQLILEKIFLCDLLETTSLDETERGGNGFGSTGLNTENTNI